MKQVLPASFTKDLNPYEKLRYAIINLAYWDEDVRYFTGWDEERRCFTAKEFIDDCFALGLNCDELRDSILDKIVSNHDKGDDVVKLIRIYRGEAG